MLENVPYGYQALTKLYQLKRMAESEGVTMANKSEANLLPVSRYRVMNKYFSYWLCKM